MRNTGVVLPFCELSFSVPKPADPRIPSEIVTLGDHLRKRRIELGLTLKQVGEKFGVVDITIVDWEQGHHQPHPKHDLGIIEFLGYDPFPKALSLSERLGRLRLRHGLTVVKFARLLGVGRNRYCAWERGKQTPDGQDVESLKAFLEKAESNPDWLAQAIESGKAILPTETKTPATIGGHLFTERQKRGLTQAQAAQAIGVSHSAYARWETGTDTPDHRTLPKLIQFLGYLPKPPEEPHRQFRFYRQALGYSVERLAKELRVSKNRLCQIDAGKAQMDERIMAWLEERVRVAFPAKKGIE